MSRVAGTMETIVVAIGGAAFTFLGVTALTIWIAPLLDIEDDPARALAQAEAYLMVDDFGWVMLGAAGVGAGVMIAMCSFVALRSGNVPGWLGVLAGVASLASVAFFGMIGWLVWILGASIGMLVRRT